MSCIYGETLICQEADERSVELVVFGDEYYVLYETRDGHTVVYDNRIGCYCYAILEEGRFASSGIPIRKAAPDGIRRHLQESEDVQRAKFKQRYRDRHLAEFGEAESDRMFTRGPASGLLSGRRVSQGNVEGLTILVEFTDVDSAVTRDEVRAMLNDDNYTRNGNSASVRRYFQIVSHGKLNYTNFVVGPVHLSHNKKHYETTSFVPEAFGLAMDELDSQNVDLDQFDSLGDNIFDAVNFVYAGQTVYGVGGNNNNPSDLWPHNGITQQRHDGMDTHFYMLTSAGRNRADLSIGTFCHEDGHLLCRFPDIYDYGRRDGDSVKSRGIGPYCLMGSGNHLNRGRSPAAICAYLRHLVGWIDNVESISAPGQFSVVQGDYNTVLKFQTDKENEYFLVENRSASGIDARLPSSGLAIYHCDTLGSNEWQAGTEERHYQCALLQADGRRDLEHNRNADAGDLFEEVAGEALSFSTNPSSMEWDGTDSGLIVSDISATGNRIDFRAGTMPVVPGANLSLTRQVTANLLIPDDDQAGVSSLMAITTSGTVTGIEVRVEITHPYIRDLEVQIVGPSGVIATLHGRESGDRDDIRQPYTSADVVALNDFIDSQLQGDWVLHVRDLEGRDVGRLDEWSLNIDYSVADNLVDGEVDANLAIPDMNAEGVTSSIAIEQEGNVGWVAITVAISHTFIRDLQIEIVAPSGHSALLHNRSGGSSEDIRRTYDADNTPSLAVLDGLRIEGDWRLRVRDLEAWDTGVLEKWS